MIQEGDNVLYKGQMWFVYFKYGTQVTLQRGDKTVNTVISKIRKIQE